MIYKTMMVPSRLPKNMARKLVAKLSATPLVANQIECSSALVTAKKVANMNSDLAVRFFRLTERP